MESSATLVVADTVIDTTVQIDPTPANWRGEQPQRRILLLRRSTANACTAVLLLAAAGASLWLLVAQRQLPLDSSRLDRMASALARMSADTLTQTQALGNITLAVQGLWATEDQLVSAQNQFVDDENGMRSAFIKMVQILEMGSWSPPPPSAYGAYHIIAANASVTP